MLVYSGLSIGSTAGDRSWSYLSKYARKRLVRLNRKASLKELPRPLGAPYWQNVLLFGAFISLVQTHANNLQKNNRLTRLRVAIDQNPKLKVLGSTKYVDVDRASNWSN